MKQLFLSVSLLLFCLTIFAQPRVDSLNRAIEKVYGVDKLVLLHELTQEYFDGNDTKKALKVARQATALADQILVPSNQLVSEDDFRLKSTTYYLMGKAYYKRRQFSYSESYFRKAIMASLELLRSDHIADSERYLAKIESRGDGEGSKFLSKLKELETGVASQIAQGSTNLNLTTTLKLAKNYENKEDYPKAIEKYEKAVNILKDQGDSKRVIELTEHIALLHRKDGKYGEAIATFEEVGEMKSITGDSSAFMESQEKITQVIDDIQQVIDRSDVPAAQAKPNIPSILPKSSSNARTESLRELATQFEVQQDYEQSLSYYKLYQEANERLKEEEYNRELAYLDQKNEIENREREIALLQQERELQELTLAKNDEEIAQQVRFRNSLIIGSLLIASLAFTLYFLYANKRRAHKKLTNAYDDLNQTQKKLSTAEKRIKTLLKQQVSEAVAQTLLSEEEGGKISQKQVCIMFLDIRGFTPFAESRSPEDIIAYQNDVFGFMIQIIEANHGIINQFLGDGFMATFGAPLSHGNDCENAYKAAVAIVAKLDELNASGKIPVTRVGIGLHAGPVVAGNVGTEERKQYSITGNTVILASRIEQLNKQFNTQLIISEDVYKHLESNGVEYNYEDVKVKGRSEPIRILKVA